MSLIYLLWTGFALIALVVLFLILSGRGKG